MRAKLDSSILLIIFVFILSGCSVFQKKNSEAQLVIELENSVSSKDAEITRLERLLQEKDEQLNEKDLKIKELRSKLEMFGVFDN
jgi:uncharacterized membrane protein YvbJ